MSYIYPKKKINNKQVYHNSKFQNQLRKKFGSLNLGNSIDLKHIQNTSRKNDTLRLRSNQNSLSLREQTKRESQNEQKKAKLKIDYELNYFGILIKKLIDSSDKAISLTNLQSFHQGQKAYKIYCNSKRELSSLYQQLNVLYQQNKQKTQQSKIYKSKIYKQLFQQKYQLSNITQFCNQEFLKLFENHNNNYNYLSQVTRLTKLLRSTYNSQMIQQYIEGIDIEAKIKKIIDIKLKSQDLNQINSWFQNLKSAKQKLASLQITLTQGIKEKNLFENKDQLKLIEFQKIKELISQRILPIVNKYQLSDQNIYEILKSYTEAKLQKQSTISKKVDDTKGSSSSRTKTNQTKPKLVQYGSYISIFKDDSILLKTIPQIQQKQIKTNNSNDRQRLKQQNPFKKINDFSSKIKFSKQKNKKITKSSDIFQNKINQQQKILNNIKLQRKEDTNKYLNAIQKSQKQLKTRNQQSENKNQYQPFGNQKQFLIQLRNYEEKLIVAEKQITNKQRQMNILKSQKNQLISKLQKQNSQLNEICKIYEQQKKLITKNIFKDIDQKINQSTNDKQQCLFQQQKKFYEIVQDKNKIIMDLQFQIKQYQLEKKKIQSNQDKIKDLQKQIQQKTQLFDSLNLIVQSLKESIKIQKQNYVMELQYIKNKDLILRQQVEQLKKQNIRLKDKNFTLECKLKQNKTDKANIQNCLQQSRFPQQTQEQDKRVIQKIIFDKQSEINKLKSINIFNQQAFEDYKKIKEKQAFYLEYKYNQLLKQYNLLKQSQIYQKELLKKKQQQHDIQFQCSDHQNRLLKNSPSKILEQQSEKSKVNIIFDNSEDVISKTQYQQIKSELREMTSLKQQKQKQNQKLKKKIQQIQQLYKLENKFNIQKNNQIIKLNQQIINLKQFNNIILNDKNTKIKSFQEKEQKIKPHLSQNISRQAFLNRLSNINQIKNKMQ